MKVFLDTNVIVDFCAVREPFFHDASMIIDMAKTPTEFLHACMENGN